MEEKYRRKWRLAHVVSLLPLFYLCLTGTTGFSMEVGGTKDGALQLEVRGTVTDTSGMGLPGVSVAVKGTSQGTATDLNGKYFLEVPEAAVLEFSLMGYGTQEVVVAGRAEINITMYPADSELEETVVVGFGTQRKITTIGAQTSVQPDEINMPVRNLSTALVGRLSGLIGVQRSGEPGNDDAAIFIRGMASLTSASSTPLVLVDGVERKLNDIDPEDIESFTILKDASATAVYGVRGANGVIIITTKKGKAGKPNIRVRYTEGISTFTKLPDLAGGVTYMQMANEASVTRGGTPFYTQERIDNTAAGNDPYLYPNVDWVETIFNKWAANRNANINISGGSQLATYYLSAGYYSDNGILKTDALQKYNSKLSLDRYNFTSNLQLNATKTTLLELGLQGYIKNINQPAASASQIFDYVMLIPPVAHAVKYPDGKLSGLNSTSLLNPYNSLTQNGYKTVWNSQLYSNIRLTQQLDFWVPGLSVTSMFSFDSYNMHNNSRTRSPNRYLAIGRDENGELIYEPTRENGTNYLGFGTSSSGNRQFYTETAIKYNHSFDRHSVGGLLLYNQSDLISTGGDFITSLPYRSRGLAGRVNYSFADKYMMEFNFGYNGSENFTPDKRYGFFPSAGIGWVPSQEKFFDPLKGVIQFLKIRFTHGQVGNSVIGGRRFPYIGTVSGTQHYEFGRGTAIVDHSGLDIEEYPVDVTWETSTKTNLGIQLYTLNSALNLQLDLFRERREGIFLRRTSLPGFVGIRNEPYGNLGIVLNKGVDASISYNKNFGSVITQFQGNFTYAKNRIVENDDPPMPYPWMNKKGRKTTQAYGYTALGLFADSAEIMNSPVQNGDVRPGDIRFKDLNGDGKIDQYDVGPIGYGTFPEIVYGFGLTLQYKSFILGAFFQGAENVSVIMSGEGFVPFQAGTERGNLFEVAHDRWTPENPNPNAFYPRLSFGNVNDNYRSNTWFLRDASYLRLKSLEAGVELPKHWLEGVGVKSAKVFFIGYNVLTFSDFKLWDVELGSGRGDVYPNMTTYSLGVDINF